MVLDTSNGGASVKSISGWSFSRCRGFGAILDVCFFAFALALALAFAFSFGILFLFNFFFFEMRNELHGALLTLEPLRVWVIANFMVCETAPLAFDPVLI